MVIDHLVYLNSSVNHIDLWVGILSERPDATEQRDNIVGSTLRCLMSVQFKMMKYSDRFYYENAPDASKGTDKTAFTIGNFFYCAIF